MLLQVKRLVPHAVLPSKAHPGDAGLDLYASEDATIPPNGRAAVKTGLSIAFPQGFVFLIYDRSGLAFKHGLTTLAGVIDSGYRSEVLVILYNTTSLPYAIKRGDRVAQALLLPVAETAVQLAEELPESCGRGLGNFGSSGK
jgi:dUTP pyrophosphatase